MDKFTKKEDEAIELSKVVFSRCDPIYNQSLDSLLKVKDLLIKENAKEIDKEFNAATLTLLNRNIQIAESIRVLAKRGLFGSCFILSRGILTDSNMFQYLHFHPELLNLFLNETKEDYQINSEFKKSFNEGTIDKDLTNRNIPSSMEGFRFLSKACHSSSFGSQFFSIKDHEEKVHYLPYGPSLQLEKAALISLILSSVLTDWLCLVLWHRYNNNLDWDSKKWKQVQLNYSDLKNKDIIYTKITQDKINRIWPNINDELEIKT